MRSALTETDNTIIESRCLFSAAALDPSFIGISAQPFSALFCAWFFSTTLRQAQDKLGPRRSIAATVVIRAFNR
jgi:hypothetical protein